jgi:glycosyltransferase involved in cell wall biosynthesis
MSKSISVYIITKDSSNYVENTLNSIKDIANEIIVIDTGSTDNTIEIAKKYNSKIFNYKWNDDFSDVRNYALSKCTKDWILSIDSDETLEGNKEEIIKAINLKYDKLPFFFFDIFTYTNRLNDKKYKYYQKQIRLFPNIDNVLYEYKLKEKIYHPNGTNNLESLDLNKVYIKHFLKDGLKSKTKRNINILKNLLKEDSNSFYYNYLMAKECLLYDYLIKAFNFYQLALNSDDYKDELIISDICTDIIKIMYKIGEKEEALNECIRRQNICKNNPYYWFIYGLISLKEGDVKTSIDAFLKSINLPPLDSPILNDIDIITWKTNLLLGYSYLRIKDYKNAKKYLEKALDYNQEEWLILFYLGIACKFLRQFDSSEAYFRAAEIIVPEENKKDLLFSMLLMYIMSAKFDKASELLLNIVEEFSEEKEELLDFIELDDEI